MKIKTQFTNRILSFMLTVVMVLSMLPASALSVFAADGNPVAKVGDVEYSDFATAVSNWTDGTTLTLLTNVEYGKDITLNSDAERTFDGGEYTLTLTGKFNCLYNSGTLNISGGTITSNGDYMAISNSGTLNISGGTVSAPQENASAIGNNGSMTLNDGNINGYSGIYNYGTAELKGGTVTASKLYAMFNSGTAYLSGANLTAQGYNPALYCESGSETTISGGTFSSGDDMPIKKEDSKLIITDTANCNGWTIVNYGTAVIGRDIILPTDHYMFQDNKIVTSLRNAYLYTIRFHKHTYTYSDSGYGNTHVGRCDCGTVIFKDHTFDSTTGKCIDCEFDMAEAKVTTGETDTYYEILMDALTTAKSGDTVTLCKSVDIGSTEHTISEGVTFYGGEYTVNGKGAGWVQNEGIIENGIFDFYVKNYGTVKGGEFTYIFNNFGTVNGGSFNTINCERDSTLSGPVEIGLSLEYIEECTIDLSNAVFGDAARLSNNTNQDLPISGLHLPDGYAVEVDGTVVSVLPAWETGELERHTHTYELAFDDTHHWTACACGKTTEKVAHTYTENGEPHIVGCSGCEYSKSEAHTLTYSADGNTITATCSANCGYSETATISAAGKTYDGNALEATVTYSDDWQGSKDLTVAYAVKDGEALESAPVDAGTYTASITCEGVTASVDFTIAKADAQFTQHPTSVSDLIYTGFDQILINVGEANGGKLVYSLSKNGEYSTSIPQGKDAGGYTVWYYVQGDKNHKDSEKYYWNITIAKATVTVIADAQNKSYGENDPLLTYTVTGLFGEDKLTGALIRAEGENAGEYAISQGTLTAGDNYTINYVGANFTITDKTAPTGTILIKENGWNKFWNTITFGIFCKDYVDVTITADGTGSGVARVEYLLSDTALDENNIPDDDWITLTKDGDAYKFKIKPKSKVAVYVRITDEGGNVTVINSEKIIVVYEDSEAETTVVNYTYRENSDRDITVTLNGNTVKSVACEGTVLTVNTDYTVAGGIITLNKAYLDTQDAGTYTFTVFYNPMGVENSGVTDLTTTFTVKVEPTSIAGATINVEGTFTYDSNAKTPDFEVVWGGHTLVKDQDYTVSYNNNTNAGQATVTVTGKGNYSGTASGSFVIERANLTDISVQQNGMLTYDGGKALTPSVTANATALNGAKVLFMYSTSRYGEYGSMPTFTDAGTYTVHYCAYTTDNNFLDQYGTFSVTIDKATVTEPTIASKPYNGTTQTADIADTDLYTVVKNEGGTVKGSYDVVLKLKDSVNYKWSTTDNAEVTVQFVISAVQNTWDITPAIRGWTYGETAKTPVGAARYGTVKVVYSGTANDGSDYNSETAPSKAGSYTATFTVEGTEDYNGLFEQVNFTIHKAVLIVTVEDKTVTYGDFVPNYTVKYDGFKNGDGKDDLDGTLAVDCGYAQFDHKGEYTIKASGYTSSNYTINYVDGKLTVNAKPITITVEAKNTIVNTVLPTYTYKVEGLVGEDKLLTEPTLTSNADITVIGEYDITATGADAGGNYSIKYVSAKLTILTDNTVDVAAGYTEELKDYDPATVTSEDKAELDEILNEINTILDDENITDNGKKALEEVKEQVENLIKEITDAADATDTENTSKVEDVTPENVTPENKNNLEGAKADLEKALEDHGSNMTEDEKKAVEEEIARIDAALTVIENVEVVEEAISKLPAIDTVMPDDEEAIKVITDAQTVYNTLTAYEKSLVDEDTKATLDKLAAALVAYDIVEGDGSSWTEDSNGSITFVVNGLFSKFVGIKVDGKAVDKANYEVKAGSTIITLKSAFLDTLTVEEHTINVIYTDGETEGTFNVHAKANSPATGDNNNMFLWIALLFVSGTVVILIVIDRKRRTINH